MRTVAFGDDAHHELILQLDGHRVASHRHRALFHFDGAVIDRDVLVLIEFRRVGMNVDRLLGIFRQRTVAIAGASSSSASSRVAANDYGDFVVARLNWPGRTMV